MKLVFDGKRVAILSDANHFIQEVRKLEVGGVAIPICELVNDNLVTITEQYLAALAKDKKNA